MGWKLWVLLIVVLVVACLWLWRKLTGGGRSLPFIGLSPLVGKLSSMKKYVSGIGNYLLDSSDDDDVPVIRKSLSEKEINDDTTQSLRNVAIAPNIALHNYPPITIPRSWDFTSFSGTGKRERIVNHVLETLYQQPFRSVRPEWLTSPKTGRRLEVDHFNEKLNLCVETSGKQHFVFEGNGFHKTREEFLSQVWRDKYKKEIILQLGYDFFIVPYTVRVTEIPQYVISCLRELGRC